MTTLTDYKKPRTGYDITYRHKSQMASDIRYMWTHLLDATRGGEPPIDVIIWEVGDKISVQKYFYSAKFKKKFFKQVVDVLEEALPQLVQVKAK